MEWMNQSGQGDQAPHTQQHAPAQARRSRAKRPQLPAKQTLIAVIVAVLVVALLGVAAVGMKGSEARAVNKDLMQAVFLNGGQVYFGEIDNINNKSIGLSNIYYLRVNQQVQPNQESTQSGNDISLVKLGCELHGPEDKMIINREQVIFWENLKKDGQVAQAVEKYKADNPNGQSCQQQSSTGTGTSTNQNQATTPTTNTNNTTNTNTTPTTNTRNTNNSGN